MMQTFHSALEDLFRCVGEDPQREGLLKTPNRVSQMYRSFLSQNQILPQELLGHPIPFADEENILVPNIPFCSLCEHHLVPFFGQVHIAYIPNKYILGLGHIFEYVETISRQLTLQEKLTTLFSNDLHKKLNPKALLVKVSALHTCLLLSKGSSKTAELTTLRFSGDPHHQSELMALTHDLF